MNYSSEFDSAQLEPLDRKRLRDFYTVHAGWLSAFLQHQVLEGGQTWTYPADMAPLHLRDGLIQAQILKHLHGGQSEGLDACIEWLTVNSAVTASAFLSEVTKQAENIEAEQIAG